MSTTIQAGDRVRATVYPNNKTLPPSCLVLSVERTRAGLAVLKLANQIGWYLASEFEVIEKGAQP